MNADSSRPEEEKSPGGTVLRRHPPPEEPRLGFSEAPHEWGELRARHRERFFGPSEKVWHEIVPIVPHVDIHVHPPSSAHGRDFYTLVTSGMSDERMPLDAGLPVHLARAELLMYVSEAALKASTQAPWYVTELGYLAHFPFDNDTWFGHGHTIPNGAPAKPYTPGSQLTTAFLIAPFFEDGDFDNGLKLGGERVNFLWVTFLTDAEAAYKLEHGAEALLDRFEAADFPRVLDEKRSSIALGA